MTVIGFQVSKKEREELMQITREMATIGAFVHINGVKKYYSV